MASSTDSPETRESIRLLAKGTEEVLLRLLTHFEHLGQELGAERDERQRETSELRASIQRLADDLRYRLEAERSNRETEVGNLQDRLEKLAQWSEQERQGLREALNREIEERSQEAQGLGDFCRSENEARKANLEEVNRWIHDENRKRMAEAEALRARLEREKQELREFMELDSKAMNAKLRNEEEARARKEQEMAERLKEQQEASENEIIQLHKRMAAENVRRKEEIEELRARLEAEKETLRKQMDQERQAIEARLERENEELRQSLASGRKHLQANIDDNHHRSSDRIHDLSAKLAQLLKDSSKGLQDLNLRLAGEVRSLRSLMAQPLSVYFDAFRFQDYLDGGEDYLTFQGTHSNLGGGMDAKSGVFTAPLAGAYLFIVHACTHDMHKALLTLRHNNKQVASFYDQNHESNHKNSMVGQSVLLELEVGDKVQVYMFTGTGLQDKPSNHLTHFVGLFLRPKGFGSHDPPPPPPILATNGHS